MYVNKFFTSMESLASPKQSFYISKRVILRCSSISVHPFTFFFLCVNLWLDDRLHASTHVLLVECSWKLCLLPLYILNLCLALPHNSLDRLWSSNPKLSPTHLQIPTYLPLYLCLQFSIFKLRPNSWYSKIKAGNLLSTSILRMKQSPTTLFHLGISSCL